MSAKSQGRQIAISVAPPTSLEVEYFDTIARTIIITNKTSNWILIEDIALRFHSDSAETYLDKRTDCGWELAPGAVYELEVEIIPTPLYSEATNEFDVRVGFRITDGKRVGDPQYKMCPRPSFIIPREPKIHVGQVFISLKQPEDLVLGYRMAKMARRAGLVPFLKDDNRRLSEDIWKNTIEPAMRNSDICIVIWTDKTNWKAEGVEREISICREIGIPEALFLEQDLPVPQLYEGSPNEWTLFDRKDPGVAFADGVEALRRRLLGRG
ncbi:MAG: hypothetical protein ABSA01_09945 [Anaerolineales bacterium]|jgi:hypothetical protein